MLPSRDKNGRFLPIDSGADPAAVGAFSPPTAPMPAYAAGPNPASISMLEQHQQELSSLKAEYEKLVALSDKSAALEQESGNVEHAIENIAEHLLQAQDSELERDLAKCSAPVEQSQGPGGDHHQAAARC